MYILFLILLFYSSNCAILKSIIKFLHIYIFMIEEIGIACKVYEFINFNEVENE